MPFRARVSAAVIDVCLYKLQIQEIAFNIHPVFFWTDSTLVLRYIKDHTHRFKVSVAKRI